MLKQSSEITLDDGLRVLSPPPPSSGVLLSFMLNVLDGECAVPFYGLTYLHVQCCHKYCKPGAKSVKKPCLIQYDTGTIVIVTVFASFTVYSLAFTD